MSSITRDIAFVRYSTAISEREAPSSTSRSISPTTKRASACSSSSSRSWIWLALAELAPQALGDAAAVVGDHRVGGRQDRLRRAVVLLELDHARVGEVVLEVEDVAHVGAAEAVDRLRIVADDRQVAVPAGMRRARRRAWRSARRPPPTSSCSSRYWAWLVSWYSSTSTWRKALRVALADLLEQLEQVDRAEQQVVEVHRVHAVQVALVELVDVGDHLLERRADRLAVVRGVDAAGSWRPRSGCGSPPA